ncbi:class I SAM-dependent methyltransferase [Halosegnis marinus]|uniref:Class I SAM-dependent methyltransferase n=1 Tax=Halosegnis marinus TaxID=3034023 RepID=A0ABD5ZLL9_9EURY|nr:class I SAM-dependent methyltransferase [Halosegnis sp. DT85]
MLDEREDAYGAVVRDHHAGEEPVEIIERDDGWIGVSAGAGLYFAEYEDWSGHERAGIDRAEGRVLDVGCGAGRVGLYLQDRGHEVVGIDVSPGAVEVSRDRGLDARGLDAADARDLDGEFDTVVMYGNNFGLVGTRATAPRILGGLAAVTSDDARILAATRDPYATDEPAHTEYHDFNRERGRLGGALRIRTRYGRRATPWFDYLMVSPAEMREVLAPTAWELHEVVEPNALDGSGGYVADVRKA